VYNMSKLKVVPDKKKKNYTEFFEYVSKSVIRKYIELKASRPT